MGGLVTIAGLAIGAAVGGFAGWLAAFIWADWEGFDGLAYIATGTALGAVGGAYIATELVA